MLTLESCLWFDGQAEAAAAFYAYWRKLTAGGEEQPCGWLKERYGVSWQIVPKGLMELLDGPDKAASQRAVQAMLQMKKLDIAALRRAYDD